MPKELPSTMMFFYESFDCFKRSYSLSFCSVVENLFFCDSVCYYSFFFSGEFSLPLLSVTILIDFLRYLDCYYDLAVGELTFVTDLLNFVPKDLAFLTVLSEAPILSYLIKAIGFSADSLESDCSSDSSSMLFDFLNIN